MISYVWGQKHYPIPYDVSRVLLYMAGAVMLLWIANMLYVDGFIGYAIRAILLVVWLSIIWKLERNTIRPLTP